MLGRCPSPCSLRCEPVAASGHIPSRQSLHKSDSNRIGQPDSCVLRHCPAIGSWGFVSSCRMSLEANSQTKSRLKIVNGAQCVWIWPIEQTSAAIINHSIRGVDADKHMWPRVIFENPSVIGHEMSLLIETLLKKLTTKMD